MKKTYLLLIVGLAIIVASSFLMLTSDLINAQECRVVRLWGGVGGNIEDIRIEPKTIWISKGTCVIWINWIRAPEVQVVFEEGRKCEDITDAPTGFKLDAKDCYVTSFVSAGETSSLRFTEKGTFIYEVRTTRGPKEAGEIVVE